MLAILLASVNSSLAQKWAVKSNLLYDATATINLGVEAALGPRVTLDISGNYNPWEFGDARWKHWLIQPEVRYWLCESFQRPLFRPARPLRRIQCGRDQFQRRLPPQPLSGTPLRCGFILRLSVADRQAVEPRSHRRPGVRPFVGSEISDRRMRRSDPHPVTQLFRADKNRPRTHLYH